jgi:predicted nucleotidyltransferase component of viral defense system
MTFHQLPEFHEALQAAAASFRMRPVLIEKDYWVTMVLRNLALSEFRDKVVFKGGTSLSKAYNCIDRFSEDVDLAILKGEGMNDYRLNKLIKAVEKSIAAGLEYQPNHLSEEKRGRNRKTFYKYPKTNPVDDFGNVKEEIQLEINSFTHPVPFEIASIESYLAKFLRENGFINFIEENQLHPFHLQVLSRERTFFEKLLSLVRLSYNGQEAIRKKVRHFYDLHKLYNLPDLHSNLLSERSFPLVENVMADDQANVTFAGEWLNFPLSKCPLFAEVDQFWAAIAPIYTSELFELSWAPTIPSAEQIRELLFELRDFLQKYDKK